MKNVSFIIGKQEKERFYISIYDKNIPAFLISLLYLGREIYKELLLLLIQPYKKYIRRNKEY